MIGTKPKSRPAAGGTYVRDKKTGAIRPAESKRPAQSEPADPKKGK